MKSKIEIALLPKGELDVLDGTLKSTDNIVDFLEEIHNNKWMI